MTTTQLLILLLVVIVFGAAGWFLFRHLRLRRRFGPEYEQVVADHAGLLAAERELRQRERRHGELQLRDLDPAEQQRYAQAWQQVQARFVADPTGAVVAGDKLVTRLIERLPDEQLRRRAVVPLGRARAHARPLPRRARDLPTG
jgi:hypothetical protein